MKKLFLLTFALMASVALMANDKAKTNEPLQGEQNLVPVHVTLQAASDDFFQPSWGNTSYVYYNNGTGMVTESLPYGTVTVNAVAGTYVNVKYRVWGGIQEHLILLQVTGSDRTSTACDQIVLDDWYGNTVTSGLRISGTVSLIPEAEAGSVCWK